MRYVLPTAPNVCSYTTAAKMNCQISTCLAKQPVLVLIPQNGFCRAMLCKRGVSRHAVSVCVCLSVRHVRGFCENE